LVLGDLHEVDVVEVLPHLGERRGRDLDAEIALRFGERHPEPPPESVTGARRPEREHRRRGISFGERRTVPVVAHRMEKSVKSTRPPRSMYMRDWPFPDSDSMRRFTCWASVTGVLLICTMTSPDWIPRLLETVCDTVEMS